jgi:SAM-dependent methyltransferase
VEAPVEFLVADAQSLPFADETFDRCHSERVLQHVQYPQQVVSEMTRVLRSGGRIALFDADWDSVLIDSSQREVTQAILRQLRENVSANPIIGRQLRRLLVRAGIVDIIVEPMTLVGSNFDEDGALLESWALDAAVAGSIAPQHARDWLDELARDAQEGVYLMTMTWFLVAGRRP